MNKTIITALLTGGIATAVTTTTHAQANDALLNKLVEKGYLSSKEADELKKEGDDKKIVTTGLGLPDWVTSLKLYGDFRGRFEEQTAESDEFHTRPRYRYRIRLGTTINMVDNFEVGFRIASGNPLTNPGGTLVGGSPVTANQDMNSFESRKFLWIDAAYAKWSPIKNNDWTVTGMIGKFDNPFQLSNMIWDYDIVPEGAGLTVAYNVNQEHSLKAIGGIFVLDELNQGFANPNKLPTGTNAPHAHPAHDPYVYGGQLLWEAKWTPKFETSLGAAVFVMDNEESLNALASPFYNSGNTRTASGFLVNNYTPIIGSASATYKFPAIPLYPGKEFPVKVAGEYMNNPGASANNEAYRVGLTLGKAGKKNTWEINYRYQRLEADAWLDAMVDDDNGAFYTTGNPQLTGTGKANGWFGGTNVKGHQIVAAYSFTDFMNVSFIYYLNELIITAPGKDSGAQHFMVDLNWKF